MVLFFPHFCLSSTFDHMTHGTYWSGQNELQKLTVYITIDRDFSGFFAWKCMGFSFPNFAQFNQKIAVDSHCRKITKWKLSKQYKESPANKGLKFWMNGPTKYFAEIQLGLM